MHCRAFYLSGLVLMLAVPARAQQSSRPYTEGPVTDVQFIRVKPGHFDDYMAMVKRDEMRDIVGDRLLRQLIIK